MIFVFIANHYHNKMRTILRDKGYNIFIFPFAYYDYRDFKKMIKEQIDLTEINEYIIISKKFLFWSRLCYLLLSLSILFSIKFF